jgi:hypothetical protein
MSGNEKMLPDLTYEAVYEASGGQTIKLSAHPDFFATAVAWMGLAKSRI